MADAVKPKPVIKKKKPVKKVIKKTSIIDKILIFLRLKK